VSNTEKFRQYADECRRLAAQVKDPELKAIANKLAASWLALADSVGSLEVVLVVRHQNTDKDEPPSLL
jgi:hypothetical protein